jgi:hypothetical protein
LRVVRDLDAVLLRAVPPRLDPDPLREELDRAVLLLREPELADRLLADRPLAERLPVERPLEDLLVERELDRELDRDGVARAAALCSFSRSPATVLLRLRACLRESLMVWLISFSALLPVRPRSLRRSLSAFSAASIAFSSCPIDLGGDALRARPRP